MKDESSYKQIVKSTSLFGSVQVVQILATVIRGKVLAIFLGTAGMGISSLLLSSINMLQAISGMGLSYSAIREISQAHEVDDNNKLSRIIKIFISLLLVSSLLGAIFLILLSPLLSDFTFGSNEYITEFIFLSSVIFINTLSNGYQSLLTGTRRLKDLSKSTILGSFLSVLVSLPFFYFFGIKGIVPAMIAASLSTFILNYFFARKINREKVNIGTKEVLKEGGEMIKLGFVMMFVGVLSSIVPFIINAYIKNNGSLTDVGLYQAGISITQQYVGLVFTAMSIDYFPRLAAIHTNNKEVMGLVNQQSEVMLLIITPILIALILTAPLVINILLTKEFEPIIQFIRLISIGLLLQAANHSMGLISFAKGDKKSFLFIAIVGNASWLIFSIIGYKIGGINGVGEYFIIHCIISFILVYLLAYKKYNYTMSRDFTKLFFVSIFLVLLVFLSLLNPTKFGYFVSSLLMCFSIGYSIYQIDKRIALKEFFSNFVGRYK